MMVVGYWTSGILRVASCSSESDQNNTVELRERSISAYVQKRSKDERERLGPKNGRREHPQQYRTYNGKSDNHELLLGYDSASWVL